jgi:beta-lactamase regulating signal transducer with metallopeptidase domain
VPARGAARHEAAAAPLPVMPARKSNPVESHAPAKLVAVAPVPAGGSAAYRSTIETAPPIVRVHDWPAQRPLLPSLAALALSIYLAVCGIFIVRLVLGLTSAVSLWLDAEPVELGSDLLQRSGVAGLRLRSSRAISSPVTIGSGVVLPADYIEWDAEKLRIVLAHERSHICQGDFYLQLLAGIYSALFWFSPLGWWLKSKLSDLAEAISDHAGLEEAASRSAYAQILLEFAAAPRPALIGVAMARSSSLSQRIERLLNDASFRQAFSGGRRRALVAVLLVPAALCAATAAIHVEAAQETPAAALQSTAPVSGQSHVEAIESVEPVAPVSPVISIAPADPAIPAAPAPPSIEAAAPQAPEPPSQEQDSVSVGSGQAMTITRDHGGRRMYIRSGSGDGYAYYLSSDGDSYALVTQPGGKVRFNGDYHTSEIDKAEHVAHGPFLWFTHEGKSYVVDDPSVVNEISALYAPIDELGKKQEELGKQQEELGRQQEELGRKQEQATVQAPDVSAEIAHIEAALAELKAKQGKTVTQDDLSDLQGKLGDLQGKLGDLQGKIGDEQGKLGEEQGKLGEQQGRLGEEQGRLGEQQGRLAREADRRVRSIMDESLKNGKAKPVE